MLWLKIELQINGTKVPRNAEYAENGSQDINWYQEKYKRRLLLKSKGAKEGNNNESTC